MTSALITGVTGQDGSYLSEYLLGLGYEVHGTIRTTSSDIGSSRIGHLLTGDEPKVQIHVTDLGDEGSLTRLIDRVAPDEVYNLAAQSHVRASFDQPVNTGDITGLGVVRLLEAIRSVDPSIRFYQASSSEMFGSAPPPQNEDTPFHPRSPYAVAKVYAYWATIHYREAYGLHASNGILFNHESPRRGREFVTRKITDGLARIRSGQLDRLKLGNLEARRDWGHARDHVRAMHMIMQLPEPTDLVVGTGESHSVRDFLDLAAKHAEIEWTSVVVHDPELLRPSEVNYLEADSRRVRELTGWYPEISFEGLVEEMVKADLALAGISA